MGMKECELFTKQESPIFILQTSFFVIDIYSNFTNSFYRRVDTSINLKLYLYKSSSNCFNDP